MVVGPGRAPEGAKGAFVGLNASCALSASIEENGPVIAGTLFPLLEGNGIWPVIIRHKSGTEVFPYMTPPLS